MPSAVLELGTPIAAEESQFPKEEPTLEKAPTTLATLIEILSKDPPQRFPMLKTTASLLTQYLNQQFDEVLLDSVREELEGFPRYLESRKYAKNSIRTYVNHARILLRSASELGWKPEQSVPDEWRQVYGLSKARGCSRLVMYLARIRRSPADVTTADVEQWAQKRTQEGRSYVYQRNVGFRFWRLLKDCGCTELDLNLNPVLKLNTYGIALRDFPQPLRAEAEDLLRWKQAAYALDRPKGAKIRAVTAKSLEQLICRIFGYGTTVLGRTAINSMQQLVTREVIGGFVEWSMNNRGVKGRTLTSKLSHLYAAMRQHPKYASLDFNWFRSLLDGIPLESDSEPRKRKAEKFLNYEVIASIPAKMRLARAATAMRGPHAVAMLAMSEFLIRWLLVLPWRQRNLRECRVGGANPNLFKGKVPLFSDIEKPAWVRQEEEANPNAEFWMIRFNSNETKTKNEPQLFLPRQLIEPLEEYLEEFRPLLVGEKDPGTLFTNGAGNPLSTLELIRIVSQLTLRYGGRRVTPHLLRDAFAYKWLKEHPADFLTVSKALWHSNINTTIKVYGSRFNESSATCAVEAWLDEQEVATTDAANAGHPKSS
jgi:integrase